MTERFQVVITDFITGALEPEQRILGSIADVTALNAFTEQELAGRIENAHAVMLYHNLSLSRSTIRQLKCCKLIVRCGVGYDNVDRVFAREMGIAVANVPDYGTEEVADSAIGLMLSLARGIIPANGFLQDHPEAAWSFRHFAPLHRLRGRVFGIVGLGRIGTATALRAKAFGMDVVFYDPYEITGEEKALGIRRVETLNELLRQAWVVSVHCPLTPETKGMIDAEAIALMPRGSFLVNTARGAIVDEAAIPSAIVTGQLAGAGIDVLPVEPPPPEDPLIAAWRDPKHPCHYRVIVNPHSSFYAEEGLLDMRVKGAEACRKALLGKPIPNLVN